MFSEEKYEIVVKNQGLEPISSGLSPLDLFNIPSTKEDFEIICKDDENKRKKFHLSYLCQFSEEIKRKITNQCSIENRFNRMYIKNHTYSTLEAFHKILYGNNSERLTKDDLSPELKMFADEFGITFLSNFIQKMEVLEGEKFDQVFVTSIQNIRLSYLDCPDGS